MEPTDLAEVEEIKQLKARYFRLMDTKRWSEWREVLADDCVLEYTGGPGPDVRVEGGDAVVDFVSGSLDGAVSVHQGHMPEIELTGPGTARGTWAMSDVVEWTGTGRGLRGFGHYEDEYVKVDGRWRVRRMRITRLRVEPLSAPGQGTAAPSEKKT